MLYRLKAPLGESPSHPGVVDMDSLGGLIVIVCEVPVLTALTVLTSLRKVGFIVQFRKQAWRG